MVMAMAPAMMEMKDRGEDMGEGSRAEGIFIFRMGGVALSRRFWRVVSSWDFLEPKAGGAQENGRSFVAVDARWRRLDRDAGPEATRQRGCGFWRFRSRDRPCLASLASGGTYPKTD